MAIKYLLDTNVAIYFLKNSLPKTGKSFLLEKIIEKELAISFITQIELLAYPSITANEIKAAKAFINLLTVIGVDADLVDKTITIRKQSSLKLPDAMIAATALNHNVQLITANTKDFNKVNLINIVNPLS
jgi:predicted nucleic acid-binding protein